MNKVNIEHTLYCEKNAIIALFNEYLNLSQELDKIEHEQLKRNKSDNNKLVKLEKDYNRYTKKCANKKSPKNTINNRKQLCNSLKLDFEKLQNFIRSSGMHSSNIYNIIESFIFCSMNTIKKEHAEFTKKMTISKTKLEFNITLIEKQISENFTVYELCECLNIDYQILLNLDLSNCSLMDTLLKLQNDSSNVFSPMQSYKHSNETLADLIYANQLLISFYREPIRETTFEWWLNYKIEYNKNESQIIQYYCSFNY